MIAFVMSLERQRRASSTSNGLRLKLEARRWRSGLGGKWMGKPFLTLT